MSKDSKKKDAPQIKKQPDGFAPIPSTVRFSKEINWFEKVIYGEILSLSQSRGYAWASNSTLAEWYGVSVRSISRAINNLHEAGFIKMHVDQSKGNERRIFPNDQHLVYMKSTKKEGEKTDPSTPMDKSVYSYGQNCLYPMDKSVYPIKEKGKENLKNNTHTGEKRKSVCVNDENSIPLKTETRAREAGRCSNIESYCESEGIRLADIGTYISDKFKKYLTTSEGKQYYRQLNHTERRKIISEFFNARQDAGEYQYLMAPSYYDERGNGPTKEFERWFSKTWARLKRYHHSYCRNHNLEIPTETFKQEPKQSKETELQRINKLIDSVEHKDDDLWRELKAMQRMGAGLLDIKLKIDEAKTKAKVSTGRNKEKATNKQGQSLLDQLLSDAAGQR